MRFIYSLIIAVLLSISAAAEDGVTYPDSARVRFSRHVNFDTVAVTIQNLSSNPLQDMFVSVCSDTAAELIVCFVDGNQLTPSFYDNENGTIYPNKNTTRWVIGNFNLSLSLQFYSPNAGGADLFFSAGHPYPITGILVADFGGLPPPVSGFSPANGQEISSLLPPISWTAVINPDPNDSTIFGYVVRLAEDPLFTAPIFYDTTDPGIVQLIPASPLNDNSHCFYQVRTIDNNGASSPWSQTQNFYINLNNSPPEPFALLFPDNNSGQVGYYTRFTWRKAIDHDPLSVVRYRFKWSADSTFAGLTKIVNNISDSTVQIPTDTLGTLGQELYWQVLAIDDDSLSRVGGINEHTRHFKIFPPGDVNSNSIVNGLDVVFLVNYLKGIGRPPDPLLAGDANGNCHTDGLDVIYLTNYFKGFGPAPARGICGP